MRFQVLFSFYGILNLNFSTIKLDITIFYIFFSFILTTEILSRIENVLSLGFQAISCYELNNSA